MGKTDLCTRDLPRAALAAQLRDDLVDLAEVRGPDGFALADQAAAAIQSAADAAARNPLQYREGKKQGTRVKSITARILKISVREQFCESGAKPGKPAAG